MTVPKLESHLEARLWNDVFTFAQQELGVDHGTIKATVLIETFPAAFEMEEILYELRDHSAGLNAGRWDYIFSVIKSFRERPEFVLPDRAMAALIPSRRDPEANERALSTPGDVIEEGVVAYIDSWLNGNGAAAINNLMEDAATAEISPLAGGGRVTPELVRELAGDASGPAYELFEATALDDELPELLTLPAYERLEG